ncbi:uncharacterized protein LOC104929912 isoform X6 [Larimichthys crocea]|uniref:uncharacterized protein LOC104929912 isoform X6 n=1 Tax=Larimichthys crocea TaxID=215358 RepID=UPI000F5EAF0E|nr:uncharacterized protein LOC104929912 isoform X6 [Larimichthys crocea]
MDLPFEMDSSTISGSINDQPTSTHNHDGLLVEECCQSVFVAPDSSTSDHESPHLKAGISESESSEKLLSFHYGSDKKHSYSSDADDEDEDDLFSNSGSGEEYQPSSTPSSSDSEEFSEKEKKSSRHTIPEKDHCHQSSGEHEQLEALDLSTKNTSPHPFEKRKGGKKGGKKQQGGDKRQKVTVNTSQKKGKRTRNKPQYCVYCGKSNLKIARHLQRKHKDEADVAHAFSFPVGSKERKVLLETLRNKGNWQHNLKVLEEGNGEIVTWKRPSEKTPVSDYLPCQHCYAMFKRTELWRHEKTCRARKVDTKRGKRGRIQKTSSQLIPIMKSSDGIQNLIHTMLQDKVTSQIRSDTMICKYGDTLFARKGREQSQHRYIARKMRELGRFVMAAKEIDKSVKGLKDLCDPTKFNLTIKAVRRVSNYSTSTTEYAKPSTAVKIGFSLKGATETWIGHCLRTSDVLGEQKAKKFKELLESSWSSYVSTNAHSTMEQRRWNKEDCVPLTEDVITLQNYLRKIEDESKAELKKSVSTTAYKRLCESLLAQIIVFNKNREGEASRLTLETYLKADTAPVNKDIYDTLSPMEKQMSHRLTRIVTRGKRGRKVPILLLERTRASLDFLIKKRSDVGILDDNPYLFARIGTTTNIHGCDCLRKYAVESKASNPELLRSTKLRKHVATLCQLLNLDHQELEQVARFMGHDMRVHCEYYRQTDKTFQVAKIGKLLFAMEQGAKSLKGKSLKTLDSVVFDERHDRPPTTGSRRGEEGQTSGADRPLEVTDDGDLQHLSTPSSPVERPKKTATRRRHDDNARSESDVDEEESQQQTPERPPVDWSDDERGGKQQPMMNTPPPVKRRKKTSTKQKHDEDTGDEEQSITATKSSAKKRKKTAATATAERGKTDAKIQVKRPWTNQEKSAVQRGMAKFIALKKVPGKTDCLLCIRKESPVLRTRTWKDIKYFVHNEIVRNKRKLEF